MFLVNSRVGRFSAAPSRSPPRGWFTLLGRPLSRSYGANLPSSLTRDHPSTLVLSHPATSVGLRYGRPRLPPRAFSRRLGSTESPKAGAFEFLTPRQTPPKRSRLRASTPHVRWGRSAYRTPRRAGTLTSAGGDGISTVCPSPTPFGLGLGPPNPTRMDLASETSAIRWGRLLTSLKLLMPAFALVWAPPSLTGRLRRPYDAPLPPHNGGPRLRLRA